MIKKLLSIAAFCTIITSTSNAQLGLIAKPEGELKRTPVIETPVTLANIDQKVSTVNIADTLWYFFNKTFYKNPGGSYYTYGITPTGTLITHGGSRFQNVGNLAVGGLDAILSRAVTTSSTASARLILCNVTSGQPVLPGLDSVTVVVGTATNTSGYFYGGNFSVPKFVSGDYAVVVRNVSSVTTDTIRFWMTNGLTTTFGEGMGHMRIAGNFTNTTNIFGSPTNNDFEILVAPRVVFTASAAQSSSTVSPYCTGTMYTFNNMSSYWLGHRQYNLNEFYRRWKPFTNTITAIAPDSVFTWDFGDGTGNFYTPSAMPNINHSYSAAGTFNGTLTAMYQRMNDSGTKATDATTFSKTVSTCIGVQSLSGAEAINVYPNPSTGQVNIANLPSESTIEVVNMLGQSVYKSSAGAGNFTADLSALPNGSYFVKINAVNEKTKIVKLILN